MSTTIDGGKPNGSFKIETGIPVPPGGHDKNRKYPFATMNVGDSVFVAADPNNLFRGAAYAYGKANGKKFTVRKMPDGFRCWRTA